MSEGYSAAEQGMQAGDVIKEINGRNVHIWDDVSLYTLTHPNETSLEVVYERDGEEYTAVIEPRQLEGDTTPKLGVTSGEGGKARAPGRFPIWGLHSKVLDQLYI